MMLGKIAHIIRQHHKTVVVEGDPGQSRRTLHQGDMDAARAIMALYAPLDDGEWRTMESAPKERMVLMAAEFDCVGDWRIKVGGWHDAGHWFVCGASWTPTMWRDLPPPPKASRKKL